MGAGCVLTEQIMTNVINLKDRVERNLHEKITVEFQPMIDEIKPMIAAMEKLATTKDNYDCYLSLLSQVEGHKKRLIYAYVLNQAGANREGVAAALRILGEI